MQAALSPTVQEAVPAVPARRIAGLTRGATRGPITRLMSPGDLGEELKPFVFLDLFELDLHDARSGLSVHPHSGIATVTVITEGDLHFDDPASGSGSIGFGGFEWMRAGGGIWHGKELSGGESPKAQGFQLWIALGPDLENGSAESQYVEASNVPTVGPAHVVIGSYEGAASPARAPGGITYLLVKLAAGQSWTFNPPPGQTTAWLSVARGSLVGSTPVRAGELALFESGSSPIQVVAGPNQPAVFVIAAAVPHPHSLHLGYYSVHTSEEALERGETNIERLRKLMVEAGDRRTPGGSIPAFR